MIANKTCRASMFYIATYKQLLNKKAQKKCRHHNNISRYDMPGTIIFTGFYLAELLAIMLNINHELTINYSNYNLAYNDLFNFIRCYKNINLLH